MKTDCLILGGGLAGMAAAREALAAGQRVVLAEDGFGASPWVHGFNCPVLPEDSPEEFLRDTLRSGQGFSNPTLAEALCGDAKEILADLEERGLSFNRNENGSYRAIRPLGTTWPRVISVGNETGTAVLKLFHAETEGKMTRLHGARAVRLLREGNRVCGALLFDQERKTWLAVFSKAVILACGGFCGVFPVTTNKRDSGGDGCAMALEAGAELIDLEFIQFEPSASVWPPALNGTSMITTLFYEGAVLRNVDGERFMLRYGPEGERVGKDVLSRRIAEEVAAGRGTPHGGVWMDITGVAPEILDRDYAMYLERYQRVGIDLKKDMIELAPAPHTSLGGVRIDAQGWTCVPGLFACGEVTGGLHGANRLGGSGGLEPLVFGRRAGQAAAAWAAETDESQEREIELPVCGNRSILPELESVRARMQAELREALGVLRNGERLRRAAETLQALWREVEGLSGADAEENFRLLRLKNDLTTALLVARAALERRESVGCHLRADDPERNEKTESILIRKSENGEVSLSRRSCAYMKKVYVLPNRYVDSVMLMGVAIELEERGYAQSASCGMGTAQNQKVLEEDGYQLPEGIGKTDLLVAVTCESEEAAGKALDAAMDLISNGSGERKKTYRDLSELEEGEWDVAQISLPGDAALKEARKAIDLGMDVFMFTADVSLEEERKLKEYGRDHGCLVMGPDAGVGLLGGVAMAAGSIVRQGPIGIIGASGSGSQEVACLIEQMGSGVTCILGTGGRDLKKEVGGVSMKADMLRLEKDPETKVICLVSMLADREIMEQVLQEADRLTKPVVAVFLGADAELYQGHRVTGTYQLQEAAIACVRIAEGKEVSLGWSDGEREKIASECAARLDAKKKYFRGLYTGGTFAEEALMVFCQWAPEITMHTNRDNTRYAKRLKTHTRSEEHTLLDMGDLDFTASAPHTVFDPTQRLQRFQQELADPAVGLICMDIILGPGVAPDPATCYLPLMKERRDVVFVCSVCGGAGDPQDKNRIRRMLAEAGAVVADSNYESARLCAEICRKLEVAKDHAE